MYMHLSRPMVSAFVFATRIVQSLFYLNTKFQASSLLLWLYRPVCVGPVRKPYCWFSTRWLIYQGETDTCVQCRTTISNQNSKTFFIQLSSNFTLCDGSLNPLTSTVSFYLLKYLLLKTFQLPVLSCTNYSGLSPIPEYSCHI